MTPDDQARFGLALTAMTSAYQAEPPDEAMLDGYWRTLEEFEWRLVDWAITEGMKALRFVPKAAELRAIIAARLEIEHKELLAKKKQNRSFSEAEALAVIRQCRKEGIADDRKIREALARRSAEINWPLYWPGEEPWNQPASHPGPQRLDFRGVLDG